jgi:hypothetical protein
VAIKSPGDIFSCIVSTTVTISPAGPAQGRLALTICIALILLAGGTASLNWRPAIDYSDGKPGLRALESLAHGDSRYLAIQGAYPNTPPLPQGASFERDEPLEISRDIRFVRPAESGSNLDRQREYLATYNFEMMQSVHRKMNGSPIRRPWPIPRLLSLAIAEIALLPLMLILYLRYRLGPYRLDGKSWTVSLTSESYTYLMFKTYRPEASSLVVALWAAMLLLVPWSLFMILFFLYNKPIS